MIVAKDMSCQSFGHIRQNIHIPLTTLNLQKIPFGRDFLRYELFSTGTNKKYRTAVSGIGPGRLPR